MIMPRCLVLISMVIVFLVGCGAVNPTSDSTTTSEAGLETKVAQFPRLCTKNIVRPEIFSPNGLWLEELCYSENDQDLVLTLSNKESEVLWKLHYKDYLPQMEFIPDGGLSVVYWSNDGRYAYFSTYSYASGGGCFKPSSHGGWGLFRLELKNGNITEVLLLGDNEFAWYGFSFSPSHRQLVYGVSAKNFIILDMETEELLEINHEKDFDDGGGFIWSKDESKIVYSTGTFTSISETYSLRLIDAKTGSEKILLESDGSCYLAKELKDNNIVIVNKFEPHGEKTIFEYDLDTNIISAPVP